jgi:predicted lactoylglutathione lyase
MSDILVNIDVNDIEAAERFYCAAFALSPKRRFGNDAIELVGASSKSKYPPAEPGALG